MVVNKHLETRYWKAVDVPNTNDITAIQLSGAYGKVTIFNIYNDCTHSRNETILSNFLIANRNGLTNPDGHGESHLIWAGDFNRHHPLWDDDKDTHLFTRQALRNADGIINLMAEHDMVMTLPKGIPTLQHMRTKRYSRPDNFFCTASLQQYVTKCEVQARDRPVSTDHFPIITHIDLPQSRILPDLSHNFKTADWDEFNKALATKLDGLPRPQPVTDLQQLGALCEGLTSAIQKTISEKITRSTAKPDKKRWWNSDLSRMHQQTRIFWIFSHSEA